MKFPIVLALVSAIAATPFAETSMNSLGMKEATRPVEYFAFAKYQKPSWSECLKVHKFSTIVCCHQSRDRGMNWDCIVADEAIKAGSVTKL